MSTLVCPRCKTEPPIWQKLQPPSDDFDGDRYLCRCCGIIVTVSMTRRRMEMHGGVHMSEERKAKQLIEQDEAARRQRVRTLGTCPHGGSAGPGGCMWCDWSFDIERKMAQRVEQVRENIERELARPPELVWPWYYTEQEGGSWEPWPADAGAVDPEELRSIVTTRRLGMLNGGEDNTTFVLHGEFVHALVFEDPASGVGSHARWDVVNGWTTTIDEARAEWPRGLHGEKRRPFPNRDACPHGYSRGVFCVMCAEERMGWWRPLSVRTKQEPLQENTLDRERRRRGIVDSILGIEPMRLTDRCLSPGTHAPDCQCAEVG